MITEYEVKFLQFNKTKVLQFLESHKAKLVHNKFLMKRNNFQIVPSTPNKWIRLRQEFWKCTLTYKAKSTTDDPLMLKELEIQVDDFETTKQLLIASWLVSFVYEENYREKWTLDYQGHLVDFCFDQRPGIPEYLEIETDNEATLQELASILDLEYCDWVFGSSFDAYERYGFDRDKLRAQWTITFQNIPHL